MRIAGVALGAGLLIAGLTPIGGADAQTALRGSPGIVVASDFDEPYADIGPPPRPPRFVAPPVYQGPPPAYGYGPSVYPPPVLPTVEVYRILRENGFSPLGAPQQRGLVYTITAISPDGDDGRLVIDARNGRILRFMPAYRYGSRVTGDDVAVAYAPPAPLPPVGMAAPPSIRPPATVSARASVPLPKPMPRAASVPPLPEKSASVGQPKPSVPPAPTAALAVPAVAAPAAPKPAVTLQPTQAMPQAQDLE